MKRNPRLSFIPETPSLPSNFAEQVLDLESELDECWTAERVQQLMELYTQAIEYYCTIASPKFKLFQQKLQILLLKKDERSQEPKGVLEEAAMRHSRIGADTSIKLPRTPGKSGQMFEVSEKAAVDKILFAAETVTANSGQSIKECLDVQKNALSERLLARRKLRMSSVTPELSECDRGGGSAIYCISKIGQPAEKSRFMSKLGPKYRGQITEFKHIPARTRSIESLKTERTGKADLRFIETENKTKQIR